MTTTTTEPTTLASRLRQARRDIGWTQEELAFHAGTNQAVIQKIENNKSLRPRKINEIAAALGTTPSWLMYGTQPTPLSPAAHAVATKWDSLPPIPRARIAAQIDYLANEGTGR